MSLTAWFGAAFGLLVAGYISGQQIRWVRAIKETL